MLAPFDQQPLRVAGALLGSNRQYDPDQPVEQLEDVIAVARPGSGRCSSEKARH